MEDFVVIRSGEGGPIDGLALFNTQHPVTGIAEPVQFTVTDSISSEDASNCKYGVLDRILPVASDELRRLSGLRSEKYYAEFLRECKEAQKEDEKRRADPEYQAMMAESTFRFEMAEAEDEYIEQLLRETLPVEPKQPYEGDEHYESGLSELLADWLRDNGVTVDRLRISIAEEINED